MANLERAIVQHIKDDATLVSLLGRDDDPANINVYLGAIPRQYLEPDTTTDKAYLVYSRVGTDFRQLFGYYIVTIQFSIFAEDYGDAMNVRERLLELFHRFKQAEMGSSGNTQEVKFAWFKNAIDMKDPETNFYQVAIDCAFKITE